MNTGARARTGMTPAHRRYLLPAMSLCLMAGILLGSALPSPAWLLLCAVPALMAALLLQEHARAIAVLLLMVCVGAGRCYADLHPVLPAEGSAAVSGVIAEEIRMGDSGQVRTILRDVTLNGQPFSGGAYWSFYLDPEDMLPEGLTPGVRVTFSGSIYHPGGAENPGGFDFRMWLLQQRVTLGAYGMNDLTCSASPEGAAGLLAALRHRLTARMMLVLGDEAGGYAAAMLLGVKTLVPGEDQDAFYALGIGHILTVSGYHVGVLYGLLMALLRKLRMRRRHRMIPLVLVLCLYAALTGMHPPVVRAALLLMLHDVLRSARRPQNNLYLLSAAALIILLFSPVQLFGASFQLTFAALLGISVMNYGAGELLKKRRLFDRRWDDLLRGTLRTVLQTLGAQLGVLLPQLYWFHELPVLGLVFNLLLLPVFTVLLSGYWLLLLLCFVPVAGPALGMLLGKATGLLTAAVRWCASAPGLTLWTRQANRWTALGWLLMLAGICGLYIWRRRRKALWPAMGALILVLSVLPWPSMETSYLQLSVGDADAAILRDGGETWVIDTGEDGRELANYLHQQRLSADGVIITHLHSDHAGGLQELLKQRIPVDRLYLPAGAEDAAIDLETLQAVRALEEAGTEVIHLSRGDVLSLPHGTFTVLWPEEGRIRPGRDANLYSLTLLARVWRTTLLLTGDLSGDYEQYTACPADVLKAAHHGSSSSTDSAFLEKVAPQVTILSSQRDVTLTGAGAVYNTGDVGAVRLQINEDGFTIETGQE